MMAIPAEDAFRLWKAADLHFKTQYSLIKYSGRVKNAEQLFLRLKPLERQKFTQLGSQFKDKQQYCVAMIGAYLDGINPRFDPVADVKESYRLYLARKEAMVYNLQRSHSNLEMEGFTLENVLNMWVRSEISHEYVLMLDSIDSFLESCYNDIRCIGYKHQIFVLMKYKELFKPSKYYEKVFGTTEPKITLQR